MTAARVDGFFYGLFMDEEVLAAAGVVARNPRRAYLDGYAVVLGDRAALVPSEGSKAYGMVFELSESDLATLYGASDLQAYRPETVTVTSLAGDAMETVCYNLPEKPDPADANPEYAVKLQKALTKLGFPVNP